MAQSIQSQKFEIFFSAVYIASDVVDDFQFVQEIHIV